MRYVRQAVKSGIARKPPRKNAAAAPVVASGAGCRSPYLASLAQVEVKPREEDVGD